MDESTTTPRRLFRSRVDRKVSGVCGGLGQFFNLDPVLFRVGFVLLALTPPGIGILAYIVLILVLPERPEGEEEPAVVSAGIGNGNKDVLAYFLIGLGAILLLANTGLANLFRWDIWWPLILIGAGALLIYNRSKS